MRYDYNAPERLVNPCEDEWISTELYEFIVGLQHRCVECGSSRNIEVHHRVFRSQYTKSHMEQFMLINSKVFWKNIYWDLNSAQNLVVLCQRCHNDLHDGRKWLAKKYKESFTDIVTWNNIFYDKWDYKKYQSV